MLLQEQCANTHMKEESIRQIAHNSSLTIKSILHLQRITLSILVITHEKFWRIIELVDSLGFSKILLLLFRQSIKLFIKLGTYKALRILSTVSTLVSGQLSTFFCVYCIYSELYGIYTAKSRNVGAKNNTLPTYSVLFDLKEKPKEKILQHWIQHGSLYYQWLVSKDGENTVLLTVTFEYCLRFLKICLFHSLIQSALAKKNKHMIKICMSVLVKTVLKGTIQEMYSLKLSYIYVRRWNNR